MGLRVGVERDVDFVNSAVCLSATTTSGGEAVGVQVRQPVFRVFLRAIRRGQSGVRRGTRPCLRRVYASMHAMTWSNQPAD